MNNERYNQIIDEAYENYINKCREEFSEWRKQNPDALVDYREDSKELFTQSIKDDKHWFTGEKNFSEKWGLKFEERELIEDERYDLCAAQKSKMTAISEEDYIKYNIPTKLITITYNNEIVESYE